MSKPVFELLDTARHHIDGGVDCRTHEYHALDHLERAVRLLAYKIFFTPPPEIPRDALDPRGPLGNREYVPTTEPAAIQMPESARAGEAVEPRNPSVPAAAPDSRVTLTRERVEKYRSELLRWCHHSILAVFIRCLADQALAAIDLDSRLTDVLEQKRVLHEQWSRRVDDLQVEYGLLNDAATRIATERNDLQAEVERAQERFTRIRNLLALTSTDEENRLRAEVERLKADVQTAFEASDKDAKETAYWKERAEAALKPVSEEQIREICDKGYEWAEGIPSKEYMVDACREVLALVGAKMK